MFQHSQKHALLTPGPVWLLSLQMSKHVTTNMSVDQTSDELDNIGVYSVRDSNDALEVFTDDVEKQVINQPCFPPCMILFVETFLVKSDFSFSYRGLSWMKVSLTNVFFCK